MGTREEVAAAWVTGMEIVGSGLGPGEDFL